MEGVNPIAELMENLLAASYQIGIASQTDVYGLEQYLYRHQNRMWSAAGAGRGGREACSGRKLAEGREGAGEVSACRVL